MPWSDNSGNGNGSNGGRGPTRGPWGQQPRNNGGGNRGGGEPPDLEELLQASRQRLKRAFPGGRGGRGGGGRGFELNAATTGLIAVGVLALWGISGFYQVEAQERGVVTTFGKFTNVTTPGLHWHVPAPVQAVEKVVVTAERRTQVPLSQGQRGPTSGSLMLTGDKNIVDVEMTVQWAVKLDDPEGGMPGPARFAFNIDDQQNLVVTVGEAAIREVVGRNTLDFVQTTGRSAVQEQTQALMQATLDLQDSGVEIQSVNLEKTEPPTTEVNEAFLDVEAAKQDKEQYINQARAYANRIVPEARGQAQRILEDARAYQAQVTAEARGQASRFDAIFAEYEKAPEVTRQRMYLETVEKVLGDMNKIIVEDDAGSGVVPYLPLNELSKQGGQ
ncbi:MAG: FtsH protease activity modulator HflK [Pseudomonadota bacterium]